MIEEILTPILFLLEALVVATCVLGDWAIASPAIADLFWVRAMADATTHGVVGLLSWAVVCSGQHYSVYPLFEVTLSGALAVSVDIDHFIAAASLSIEAALSLDKRPPFHNSTLIPIVTIVLFLGVRYVCPIQLYVFFSNVPLIFFVSWTSHHIRDATRRGLWFAPFGSTPPLPTWLYRSLVCCIPLLLRVVLVLVNGMSGITPAGLPSVAQTVLYTV